MPLEPPQNYENDTYSLYHWGENCIGAKKKIIISAVSNKKHLFKS